LVHPGTSVNQPCVSQSRWGGPGRTCKTLS